MWRVACGVFWSVMEISPWSKEPVYCSCGVEFFHLRGNQSEHAVVAKGFPCRVGSAFCCGSKLIRSIDFGGCVFAQVTRSVSLS